MVPQPQGRRIGFPGARLGRGRASRRTKEIITARFQQMPEVARPFFMR